MVELLPGHLYDYPRYYDLLFGSDWKAEFDFLQECFDRYAKRTVRRLFEPACGTGRLLYKFAAAGYEVAGNDLNPRAVEFCNARLARYGLPGRAVVGDMADFRVKRPFDAAFNTINSFRHLPTEKAAAGHLQCISDALAPGGIYALGLHLTPAIPPTCDEESWSARRGHLGITSRMWSIEVDQRARRERVGMTCEIYTPSRRFRIREEMHFRTYSLKQFRNLLAKAPKLELVETFDFAYDIDEPIDLDENTEDALFILRKRK